MQTTQTVRERSRNIIRRAQVRDRCMLLCRGCQDICVTFLHWHPLPEQNHELIERGFPFRNRLGPLFGDMLQPHIQELHDRLVIREGTTAFQHFT